MMFDSADVTVYLNSDAKPDMCNVKRHKVLGQVESSRLVCCVATHRQKHKEETLKLKQELASLRTASKGGQQGQDRSKKELDMAKWVHMPTAIPIVLCSQEEDNSAFWGGAGT